MKKFLLMSAILLCCYGSSLKAGKTLPQFKRFMTAVKNATSLTTEHTFHVQNFARRPLKQEPITVPFFLFLLAKYYPKLINSRSKNFPQLIAHTNAFLQKLQLQKQEFWHRNISVFVCKLFKQNKTSPLQQKKHWLNRKRKIADQQDDQQDEIADALCCDFANLVLTTETANEENRDQYHADDDDQVLYAEDFYTEEELGLSFNNEELTIETPSDEESLYDDMEVEASGFLIDPKKRGFTKHKKIAWYKN